MTLDSLDISVTNNNNNSGLYDKMSLPGRDVHHIELADRTATQSSTCDFARQLGYRDCGYESIRFLTEVAGLDPDDPVVLGVRKIVDQGSSPVNDDAATNSTRVQTSTQGRRRRKQRQSSSSSLLSKRARTDDRENQKPTTGGLEFDETCDRQHRRLHPTTTDKLAPVHPANGRSVLGENRLTPSLYELPKARVSRCCDTPNLLLSTCGTHGVVRCSQCSSTCRRKRRASSESGELYDDDENDLRHANNDKTEVDCAVLERLARRDLRVNNLLNELMYLLEAESNETAEM